VIGRSRVPVLPGIRQDQNTGRGASSSVLFSWVSCAPQMVRGQSVALSQFRRYCRGFSPRTSLFHTWNRYPTTPSP
jgi:hypothetical protein